ncbi:uncharacterized protein Dyak_GE24977 [Drosophila yakuba]|uniref:Homeobox domain-containing protein n=1 Tax=Drosophila yakuba TaxID=7245 RepID=B4PQV2_DROYA|nr:uncharacterized protein Dyak_GE24977 [Drosophila yakuba]
MALDPNFDFNRKATANRGIGNKSTPSSLHISRTTFGCLNCYSSDMFGNNSVARQGFQCAAAIFYRRRTSWDLIYPATLNIFATRSNPKKKRKSRTAFTNQQIFELEKRFLYQKYLSPADRDEIASGLGLSNAQVITWFQNRRAKLKRDMEELKKDVQCEKIPDQSADPNRSHHHHPHHHHPHMQIIGSDRDKDTSREKDKDKDKDKEELRMLKLMTLMRYSDGKLLCQQPPALYLPISLRQNTE